MSRAFAVESGIITAIPEIGPTASEVGSYRTLLGSSSQMIQLS